LKLTSVDWLIMLLYFVFVLGIGFALKRYMKTSKDFFQAGRALPAWICGLAFISANLGAQEVIGMGASGAKYGLETAHFYGIGAIPAMIFVGIFMMPFYYGSKARSVPEFLRLRFDEKTRALNACSFAVMTVFSSGISMYAMARLIQALHVFDGLFKALGWAPGGIFTFSIVLSAVIVLLYIFLGGLTSAIYNEVLQFFLIIAGFLPLVLLGLKNIGGWAGLKARLVAVEVHQGFAPGTWTESWKHMGHASANPMGVEWFGLAMGLGFVLSFGYWCTDFLVVQRAMAADSVSAARRTPILAAFPKMLLPFIVILPGLVAVALMQDHHGGFALPAVSATDPSPNYNMVMPVMLGHYLPTGLLGLGFTALIAAFMSGMAGNVTAFNTVWTYDIYQSYFEPDKSDAHYLRMGRLATVFGVILSVGVAYLAAQFNNIMNLLQLVFAFVNAPLFATFLLGMFWRRANGHGAFFGLLLGTLAAAVHHGLTLPAGAAAGVMGGWLGTVVHTYPSAMAQNFWTAIFAWSACMVVTIGVSLATAENKPDAELRGLVYSLTPKPADENEPWHRQPVTLGVIVLAVALALNLVFA